MRGSFTDSVGFSLLLAVIWCSRHFLYLCGLGHDVTLATDVCARASVCVCRNMYVDVFLSLYAHVCVSVWGEWRAACPCLVWLSFTRPLGSRELDSLTAWTGRREPEREGKRGRRGGKKRGGGTLRARHA